jgi:hypothetical protein
MAAPTGYNGLDDAKTESRYPFLAEEGVHIIVIESWLGKDTFNSGFCDICEVKVVATLKGDASAVGDIRSRIRSLRPGGGRDMALMEVKTRLQVVLSSAAQAEIPGFSFPASNVTQAVMEEKIQKDSGRSLRGYPIKVQVNQTKTKKGADFTNCNYSVPTKADLEGLKLDSDGRVIG